MNNSNSINCSKFAPFDKSVEYLFSGRRNENDDYVSHLINNN